jgi:hypothetical protein
MWRRESPACLGPRRSSRSRLHALAFWKSEARPASQHPLWGARFCGSDL